MVTLLPSHELKVPVDCGCGWGTMYVRTYDGGEVSIVCGLEGKLSERQCVGRGETYRKEQGGEEQKAYRYKKNT